MNRKQQAAYDKIVKQVLERFGSTHAIAVRSHQITDDIITGETVRLWFRDRKIPAEFVFTLYQLMDFEFDPLILLPWLARWVDLKPQKTV